MPTRSIIMHLHYVDGCCFTFLDFNVLGDDAWIHANQTSMCLDPHLNLG